MKKFFFRKYLFSCKLENRFSELLKLSGWKMSFKTEDKAENCASCSNLKLRFVTQISFRNKEPSEGFLLPSFFFVGENFER
jgi:hypothetical protein